MTLLIITPKWQLEINDAYLVALTFIIFYAVGSIIRKVIEKLARTEKIKIANPKGGAFHYTDENELASVILACIANNELYIVRDARIIDLVFTLVKQNIKNQSLVLAPNLIRLIALKLTRTDQNFMMQFGSIIISSDNRSRLITRLLGAGMIGVVSGLLQALSIDTWCGRTRPFCTTSKSCFSSWKSFTQSQLWNWFSCSFKRKLGWLFNHWQIFKKIS